VALLHTAASPPFLSRRRKIRKLTFSPSIGYNSKLFKHISGVCSLFLVWGFLGKKRERSN